MATLFSVLVLFVVFSVSDGSTSIAEIFFGFTIVFQLSSGNGRPKRIRYAYAIIDVWCGTLRESGVVVECLWYNISMMLLWYFEEAVWYF